MRLTLELIALALIVLGCFKAYDDLDRATHDIGTGRYQEVPHVYDQEQDAGELVDVLLLPCAYEAAHGRSTS